MALLDKIAILLVKFRWKLGKFGVLMTPTPPVPAPPSPSPGHPASTVDVAKLSMDAGQIFTPGAPINERALFSGRLDQVQKIMETISQRGYHAVLYGERGVGKTSLSNVLSGFLVNVGQKFFLPRVNCDASDDFSSLWRKQFSDIILTETKPGIGFNAVPTVENKRVLENLPQKLSPDDVRRMLAHLSAGTTLVPIFDEFDRVQDPNISTLMADTIKGLSDYSINATLIIIGVADSVEQLIHEHQSIERALVQIPMPRMSAKETADIVSNGLRRLGMSIQSAALQEITALSQGLPYVTHLLALHSTRAALTRRSLEITPADIDAGMKRSLDQWQQSIKSAYYHATKSQQPGHIFREVILACAFAPVDELGFFSAADVRDPLRTITTRNYDIPNFARHLKELSEQGRGDLLFRTGEKRRVRYRFNSPLMRPYIIMRGFSDGLVAKTALKNFASMVIS